MRVPFYKSPGVDTYYHEDPDRPGFTLEKVFDREPVLEHCAQMRRTRQRAELRKVASIPTPIFYQWLREGKLNGCMSTVEGRIVIDQAKLSALLNDPDWKNLKCIDGKV